MRLLIQSQMYLIQIFFFLLKMRQVAYLSIFEDKWRLLKTSQFQNHFHPEFLVGFEFMGYIFYKEVALNRVRILNNLMPRSYPLNLWIQMFVPVTLQRKFNLDSIC